MDFFHEYELVMIDMLKYIGEITWGGHEKKCPLWSTGVEKDPMCNCIQGVSQRAREIMRLREKNVFDDEGDGDDIVRADLNAVRDILHRIDQTAGRTIDEYLVLCRRERQLEARLKT